MANTNPIASLTQIRARLEMTIAFTDHDAWLSQALLEVSRDVENWAGWSLRRDTRTELLGDYPHSATLIQVNGVHPVESVTSIKEAIDRDFDAADALVEDQDFVVYEERNQIARIAGVWLPGHRVIQVIYVGGYVTPDETAEAGQEVMPDDLVGFVLDETERRYRLRGQGGKSSVSTDGGSVSFTEDDFAGRANRRIYRHRKVTLL